MNTQTLEDELHARRNYIAELAKNKIPLSPIAEAIQNGTYETLHRYDELMKDYGSFLDHDTSDHIWNALKPERNARIALVIEKVWSRFLPLVQERSRELISILSSDDDFIKESSVREGPFVTEQFVSKSGHIAKRSLNSLFRATLKEVIYSPHMIIPDEHELRKHMTNVERLEQIVMFGLHREKWHSPVESEESVSVFIARGFGTARIASINFMCMLLNVFKKHSLPITRENILHSINASVRWYPFFAGFHLHHGPALLDTMRSTAIDLYGPFSESYFEFDPHTRAFRVNVTAVNGARIKQTTTEPMMPFGEHILSKTLDEGEVTTGCPAGMYPYIFKQLARAYGELLVECLDVYEKKKKEGKILESQQEFVRNFLMNAA